MPRAIFIILIVSGVSGYLFSKYFYKPSPSYKILETRDFSCPGMTGFTFKYPVFEGWGVKRVEKIDDSRCHILLDWPYPGSPTIAPSIEVKRTSDYLAGNLSKNSQGISYLQIKDTNGIFSSIMLRINLSSAAVVKLINVDESHGFSRDQFWETVIESFRVFKVVD